MPTTRAVPSRGSWLLVLVVLGILGMHGLTGGTGTTGEHHTWTPGHHAAATAHDSGGAVAHDEEPGSGTTLALCLVLLMSLGVSLLAARRGAWPVRPHGLPARLPLPSAPLLRVSTPVPRFTVMRC